MDLSKKKAATDTQDTIDQSASGRSSSGNDDSPDPSSRVSRTSRPQTPSKSPKSTVGTKIVDPTPTMLNVSLTENHKSSTSTTNAINNEEESRVEVSGKVTNVSTYLDHLDEQK